MSTADPTEMLRRILGEEGDALIHMVQSESSDKALLHSAGIDIKAMVARTQVQINRAAKLSQLGINPPVPLEELSEEAFNALDVPTLKKYLAASDVDVDRLAARVRELINQTAPRPKQKPEAKPKAKALEKILGFLQKATGGPAMGFAISAAVLVAVGVGVWRLTPQAPLVSINPPQARELAVTLDAAARPATQALQATGETNRNSLLQAPSLEQALSSPITANPLSASISVDEIDQAVALSSVNNLGQLNTAAQQNAESNTLDPTSTSGTASIATSQENWAVTHKTPEPAPKQTVEFVFQPGDTFSHGMARSGLPASLSTALAERVGTSFHPGDKLIIFFENDEFEQLVVIRRKKQPLTVTADLKTVSASVEKTEIIDVTGAIESSLYVALEKALDANTAQRITWLLQSRAVPLTTLPKGTSFSVSIEKITGASGETLGFGEIKSVHLDAGKRGKFAV